MTNIIIITILLVLFNPIESMSDTHTADNCTQTAVATAITASEAGDVVAVPAGECTWGASGSLAVDKSIIIQGAGVSATIVTLGVGGTTGISVSGDNATVKDFKILGSTSDNVHAFSISGDNFRVSNIYFDNTGATGGYFVYAETYGLIDNCTIIGCCANNELIFTRGPTDAWQSANTIGTVSNVFVENCTFGGSGYVSDINSNGQAVFRWNTVTGPNKIDGHGKCSNSPARGVRNLEIYNNHWTGSAGGWLAMELRGGTGLVFNNNIDIAGTTKMQFKDYSTFQTGCAGYTPLCCCGTDYPCDDQIGVGVDPKSAASEPYYVWGNTQNGSAWVPYVWTTVMDTYPACKAVDKCGSEYTTITQIQADRDYFVSESKPEAMSAYTPYTCPHPLTGLTGTCDSAVAGTAGYNVAGTGTALKGSSTGSGSLNMR